MRSVWRMKTALVCGLVVFGVLVVSATRQAEARPNYQTEFLKKYEEVAKANDIKNTVRCGVCHIGKPADKKWNAYGKAMAESLKKVIGKDKIEKPGVKDPKQIDEALKKTEEAKSEVEGKTFGDLLKAKQLPAKNETKEEKK